jgi:hypothetical protein
MTQLFLIQSILCLFVGFNPLFASLLGAGTQNSDGISSVSDGRDTSFFVLQGVAKGEKTGKDGREKEAIAYCAAEHNTHLTYIAAIPESFNASESSDKWKIV